MLSLIQTPDKNLQLIQSNVNTALTPLQNSPLTGGVLLTNVSLKSGQDNLISHNLGHVPVFAFPGLPNVSATIWSPASSALSGTNASMSQINLRCSSNCIVSVWLN